MISDVSIVKRAGALLVDILFVVFLYSLVVNIKFINPNYEKYLNHYENYIEITNKYRTKEIEPKEYLDLIKGDYYALNKYSIGYNLASVILVILYFCFFQKYNNGQTVGKKLFKIKVVDIENKSKVGLCKYLLRYFALLFPYIGSVAGNILNVGLIFILNSAHYIYVSSSIYYIFIIYTAVTIAMIVIRKDKRGLSEIITKTKVINE